MEVHDINSRYGHHRIRPWVSESTRMALRRLVTTTAYVEYLLPVSLWLPPDLEAMTVTWPPGGLKQLPWITGCSDQVHALLFISSQMFFLKLQLLEYYCLVHDGLHVSLRKSR